MSDCHATGKIKHASLGIAKAAARAFGARVGDDQLHGYQCPHCGSYHVGHHRRQGKRKRRERLARHRKRLYLNRAKAWRD